MDSFKVTDEGGGIIRVDADIRLVRKPIASAMCDAVDERVSEAGYNDFKILMNMSAMSKGTPGAGMFVLRTMKKYPLRALALYGANGFMRGMAKTVLGAARFPNFELFDEEAIARDWLERQSLTPPALAPECPTAGGKVRRLAIPAAVAAAAALALRARRHRPPEGSASTG
ncbi:MAG TPA: STAS/SEC14 domain-containing protein [Acidimicrobiia bacterium]|nr:STAS/SEC14 domain-containing protein [Acidimicrobiia bacterium]